jgi:mannose-1-phosphate guanylyltransferase
MYVMIMAGGAGTRFWPMSRRHRPKQLLSLFGGKPMIAETVSRFEGLVPIEQIIVVTADGLVDAIREAVPSLPPENILAEPVGRNTAPAIGLAAREILRRSGDPATVMTVFPSDHFIRDVPRFRETVELAALVASSGAIVTLGIEPTTPETGYGYIRRGAMADDGSAAVEKFVEKPPRETALEYLADGNYVWNAGMFAFRLDTILGEIERQMPALYVALDAIGEAIAAGDLVRYAELFEKLESISIDYGVMEKATNVRVIPVSFGWSDVGHWDTLPEVASTDARGNVTIGDVVAIDCDDSVLVGHDRRVLAAVGLQRIVVVDSEDAILVAPRDRVQEVRKVVESLRNRGGNLV